MISVLPHIKSGLSTWPQTPAAVGSGTASPDARLRSPGSSPSLRDPGFCASCSTGPCPTSFQKRQSTGKVCRCLQVTEDQQREQPVSRYEASFGSPPEGYTFHFLFSVEAEFLKPASELFCRVFFCCCRHKAETHYWQPARGRSVK